MLTADGLPNSSQAVEKSYARSNPSIHASHVDQMDLRNREKIREQGNSQGLLSNQLINHSVKTQAEEKMREKSREITEKNAGIHQEEASIKNKLDHEKRKERHGGLFHDFIHNIDTKNQE